jgi:ribosomal protein L29
MKKKALLSLHKETTEALKKMAHKVEKEIVETRLKMKSGKLKNVHETKNKRHLLARLRTIIREKEL